MAEGNVYKWSFVDRASIAAINLATNLILVRLLTSDDFGLLAMIAIFIAVASDLSSCGLSDGLIHKAAPTEMDYSTVFMFNSAFGLLFGLAFFFGAPLVAGYFGHEELITVMRALGVCFFFQTMSYVQETRLRKMLRMRTICLVRVGATLTVSVLGIAAAMLGYGYKALICTQILLSVFFFIYYTVGSRWFPKIQFSMKSFKEFFSYGVHLMLAYLATLVGRNINTFVLGRFYSSPSMSGLYYQGAKLATVPYGISEASLNVPLFVVASNEQNPSLRRRIIADMSSTMFTLNLSLLAFMILLAQPAVIWLLGSNWAGVAPVFRILAVAECLLCIKQFLMTLCKVYGRTVFVRNMGFLEVAFQLLLLLLFYRFGFLWIAATQAAGVAFAVCFYSVYCSRSLKVFRFRDFAAIVFSSAWLPALSALAGGALFLLPVSTWPAFVQCVALTAAYAAVMFGLGAITGSGLYPMVKAQLLKK
ncbi:MAG: oligosaccharide flippase family protein [Muribaculaceae bacterium]|nr:oligosaccharide flippase family protein [Muribaculaceae bacterium]